MGQYKASYSRLKLLGALKRMFENHKNCSKMYDDYRNALPASART